MPGAVQHLTCNVSEGSIKPCGYSVLFAGVTLNHLAWAASLGAPTGLLALQGDDTYGKEIRSTMEKLGVSTRFVLHGPQHATSVSHVFIDESGERSIIMAPASTSTLNAAAVTAYWTDAVSSASMVTSEISQACYLHAFASCAYPEA